MAAELALFPLNHVLLPSMPLPLHIFEPRYRQMLRDVAAVSSGHGSFGVVALQRGNEAGGGGLPDVHRVGTVAEIVEVETNADGTSEVLAVGSRRFTVEALLADGAPYLRARVTYLDEPDGRVNDALTGLTRRLMTRYDAALMERTGRTTGAELPGDAAQLSFHLAARLPLGPLERQQLLADPDAGARLRRLVHLLRRETALLRSTGSIAVSPSVLRLAALPN
ncbi:MAG: LON peptidase substrate-binding domain-containing protein [Jatrophihabitans sp.]|uniref:LON peptidase substrate-binding domain-containing protein n=1 Tax=Jatrophihabitans sp. TaxID=1932789 RepID=UPI003F7D4677